MSSPLPLPFQSHSHMDNEEVHRARSNHQNATNSGSHSHGLHHYQTPSPRLYSQPLLPHHHSFSLGSPSPVQLPEIITVVCSFLAQPELVVCTRLDRTWSSIALPLVYQEINLNRRSFKIDSLELGLLKNGDFCRRLTAARALRRMPNLLELEATWMNADLLESLVYLQRLERLSISRLQGSQPEDNLYFEPSFQGSRRIKEIDMAYSPQMTDTALVSITRTCPHIQMLTVSGNVCLTHESLIRWCESLTSSSPSPSPLQSSSSSSSSSLSLSLSLEMGDLAMTELTTINFTNCVRIQSVGFQTLFERSRNLQHVNLMSTRVEDGALQVLARQNQGLRSIVLNCCASISDQGLQGILRSCHQLESVSFLYCNRITTRVFFQTLWKCLGLKELRFSLNARHNDLIENGLGQPTTQEQDHSLSQDNTIDPASFVQELPFYEPQLEYMIFGGPDVDDQGQTLCSNAAQYNTGNVQSDAVRINEHMDVASSSASSVQEYRQRLILAQIYHQIERMGQLQILDMRDIHLPLDLASGLWRLGCLDQLQVLEWTGLEKPLGLDEVDWLAGNISSNRTELGPNLESSSVVKYPLPSLTTLVLKGGFSLSKTLHERLKSRRPRLELYQIQVRDLDS
ncbi:hypothetical protein BG011_004871 [Mortierella polycephala]|uniref:F-box domain-containing protein n=1 Tax=Mortierella polycephala TaxID=41804 RepID=A0A9P6PYZ1_9FUNG|nr:hypothetical protein BG011_004871 [Mortierella polycephala]